MGKPSLLMALDYLRLLVTERPEKVPAAAMPWHGRLELEATTRTMAASQLALWALVALGVTGVAVDLSCTAYADSPRRTIHIDTAGASGPNAAR
jgi:hypothetical protein